jgi:hypothetical protein
MVFHLGLPSQRPVHACGTGSATRAGLFGKLPGARIDLHGGRHSCRQDHTLGHLIDVDAHRNTLGQANPGEDWVDVGEPLPVGLRVCDVDAARDAADMAAINLMLAGSPT